MNLVDRIKILNNHLQAQNFNHVIEGCIKLLKKNPEVGYIYNLAGLAYQGKKQISKSIESFKQALSLEKNNFAAMNNLANSYKSVGKIDLSEDLYLRALSIKPNYVQSLNNYGNLKQQIDDLEGAIMLYEKALKIKPKEITILLSLVAAYQSSGDFKKSKECAEKILMLDPKNTSTHKLISSFTNYKDDKDHLNTMVKLIEDKSLSSNQIVDLCFALAKANEDLKNFDKSFEFLDRGNKLKKEKLNYNIDAEENLFKNIIKAFEKVDFNNLKKISNDKKIIFICGMPRSGTTLVEQIISSHSEVHGAGELVYLQRATNKYFIQDKKFNKQRLLDFSYSEDNKINDEYFESLNFHKIQSNIITDKAPQNFRWIGIMKIFFPNCKVVHCSRDAKDNCLSLFKNNFASQDMNWSYDQKDLAKYYNLYLEMMNFWKKKIPDFIYESNYEALVENHEEETKKLIKFCELEWDPACLSHHKNKKTAIQTVSVVQARQPIYKSSVNSNNAYSKHLEQLFNSLNIR